MADKNAISPTRAESFPDWYQSAVRAGDLADNSSVRGCMVIKPWGYGIWERIQRELDDRFKATGHENAYFPLFIPKRLIEREAEHVEGFAKEMAVVTHHRLEQGEDGLVPAAPLEEPLIVRPTSETIIGESFAAWIQSYRDLPLKINQWANVVRWELRPRVFLRTTEFLWQEGHTAHATSEEAWEETAAMLELYADFAERFLALSPVRGEKPPHERFPGAERTLAIEAMMQDGKALQAGTSHYLGQNFARAAGIEFTAEDGARQHAFTTSWGVSTRLIGGIVMAHADDDGLRLPPTLAPAQVAIVPILRGEDSARVTEACERIAAELGEVVHGGEAVRVRLDGRDASPGARRWEWIKRGVPLIFEVGPRDLDQEAVSATRRDGDLGAREQIALDALATRVPELLAEIQAGYRDQAEAMRRERTRDDIDDLDGLRGYFEDDDAGFAVCGWNGDPGALEGVSDLAVSVRCLTGDDPGGRPCALTGAPAKHVAVLARAY